MKMNKLIIVGLVALMFACSTRDQQMSEVTIHEIESPAKATSGEPYLFTDNQGVTYLSWIEVAEGKNYLKFSKLENEKWSTPIVIQSGENWFVNWADYPLLAANGQQLISHYLAKSAESTFAYDVMITA